MFSFNLYTLLVLGAMVCAWQLGRMWATPEAKWKQGALKSFGWKAWRPILWGIVGTAALLTVLGDEFRQRIPFMSSFGGGFGGGYGAY